MHHRVQFEVPAKGKDKTLATVKCRHSRTLTLGCSPLWPLSRRILPLTLALALTLTPTPNPTPNPNPNPTPNPNPNPNP